VIRNMRGQSLVLSLAILGLSPAHGQARGNWPVPHNDAAHSGWQKAEATLSPDSVAGKFKFLWKIKLEKGKTAAAFTEPLLAPGLINGEGFKDLVVWAGKDTVYAVDSELGTMVWQKHYDAAGACGSPLAILMEPPHVINFGARRPAGTLPPSQPAPLTAAARRLGVAAGGGGFGFRGLYVLTGDGYLHEQVLSTGADFAPPVKFLPVPSGLSNGLNISGDVIYGVTTHGCGITPNALWAIDLATPDYAVSSYVTRTASLQATMGATLAEDAAYLLTGRGTATVTDPPPNSLVALGDKDLKVKDWFSPVGEEDLAPVAFTYKQNELLAAPGKDGSLVLLDRKSPGGTDHHTPLSQTASIAKPKHKVWGGMTNWQDKDGTSWVLASVAGPLAPETKWPSNNGDAPHGSIVAFKLGEQDGKTMMLPMWSSTDMVNPAPPVVANGVVITLSAGDKKTPAKLYVLDAKTGKELYASGSEIATYAQISGVAVGDGHAFFTTHDGTLYCFGIGMLH
jgi:hypothetical protein